MLPLLILLASCSSLDQSLIDAIKELRDAYKECAENCKPEPSPLPTVEPTTIPSPEPSSQPTEIPDDYFLPKTDCNNPKSYIKRNDGFKVMASSTRGGSVVALLPYTLSRPPYKTVTDHHNQTFKASINQNFDKVELVLKNNKRISLKFAGQHNPVYLYNDKIAREHWRNTILWNKIKNKVVRLEAFYKREKVCLKP
jgi:hypothetical protein